MEGERVVILAAVLIAGGLSCCTNGERVMFMPTPATSHAIHHVHVARALRQLGHEVWLVLPSCVVAAGVLPLDDLHVIEFAAMNFVDDVLHPTVLQPVLEGREPDFSRYVRRRQEMNEGILTNKELYEEMQAVRPDLFVYDEHWTGAKMFVVFPYRMGVPFAAIDFTFDPFSRRIPFSPAVTPAIVFPFQHNMTFLQRLQNTFYYLFAWSGGPFCHRDAVAHYAPEMPYLPLDALTARAEIWLVQTDHIMDYPRPTLPNVKQIGGIAASPANILPSRYQIFMDTASQGVVIASFGSMLLALPRSVGEELLMEVFQSLPFKVIFRSNLTSPDPDKILTAPWIPQNDLLAHKNTRLFLTHCGNSGQYQALYHAVPMLGLPVRYDQFYNAQRLHAKGFGRTLDLKTLTHSQLADAILDVITQPRYKQAITKASTLFREQNGVPAERAAYWLDHVIKYGGSYMRSASQEMPLYEFLMLDILATAVVVALLCFALCFVLCYSFVRFLQRRVWKTKAKCD